MGGENSTTTTEDYWKTTDTQLAAGSPGAHTSGLVVALPDDAEVPVQARQLTALALAANGRGMNANPHGDGTQGQAVSQQGLDGRAIVGGQLFVM